MLKRLTAQTGTESAGLQMEQSNTLIHCLETRCRPNRKLVETISGNPQSSDPSAARPLGLRWH